MVRKTKTKSRVAMKRARRSSTVKKSKVGFVQVGKSRIRHGVSKVETEWLDRLMVPERSKLIRGFNNKIMIVDGYDATSKIVYEFLGETWHGSHRIKCLDRDAIDPWLKKSPNQLYYSTTERFAFFHNLGFKVFFVWEYDYKKGKTLGRYYTGTSDNLY